MNLKQFSFQFPGGSDFNSHGTISGLNSQPTFSGEIGLTSNNFPGALNWAGTKLKYIPNYTFRKLDLKSKLKLQANQAQLTDLNLRLDNSRVNGAITFALTERLSFGINAFVDRINIDTYLKNSKTNNLELGLKPLPLVKNELSKHESRQPKSEGIEDLAFLNSFDANVNLKIKKLTFVQFLQ